MMLMVYISQFYHIDIAAVWVHVNDADVGRSHGGPISGHHVTDIVNLIPDIGINIGYNIGYPDIGDMISRYRCQYRVSWSRTRACARRRSMVAAASRLDS